MEVKNRADADAWVERVKQDPDRADLSARERAMVDFSRKLTLTPASVRRDDLQPLRDAGLDDTGISDVVMVTALFAFYNRIADGLGIDLEPDMPQPAERSSNGDPRDDSTRGNESKP